MEKLLIITYIDFWNKSAGHRMRLSAIIDFLKDKISITVAYLGDVSKEDRNMIKLNYPEISIDSLGTTKRVTYSDYKEGFEIYIKDKFFDAAIIEYIELAFVLPFINPECITILDTHDLISDRVSSFVKSDLDYNGIVLTLKEELELFECFDYIMLIQNEEYSKLSKLISSQKMLLVPHPPYLSKKALRKKVNHVGFIGSEYIPNVEAIEWFIRNVWTPTSNFAQEIELNIYGNVCKRINHNLAETTKGIYLHGFIHNLDSVYEQIDLVINPVRSGAGLKIKNIEALANGLPLVTTHHGSIGIKEGVNKSFIVAETPQQFTSSIQKLIENYNFRSEISNNAYNFVLNNFSVKQSYLPLIEIILK